MWLPGLQPLWERVDKFDGRAIAVVDGHLPDGRELGPHYSRKTPDSEQVAPPGETILLLSGDGLAAWVACHNLDPGPAGVRRWRCTVFRNEGRLLSSDLIRAATALTYERWRTVYRWPGIPLTTEVNVEATRRRRSRRHPPGWSFICAGWTTVEGYERRGMIQLRAPDP